MDNTSTNSSSAIVDFTNICSIFNTFICNGLFARSMNSLRWCLACAVRIIYSRSRCRCCRWEWTHTFCLARLEWVHVCRKSYTMAEDRCSPRCHWESWWHKNLSFLSILTDPVEFDKKQQKVDDGVEFDKIYFCRHNWNWQKKKPVIQIWIWLKIQIQISCNIISIFKFI